MRIKVLTAFDIEEQSYRPGEVVEIPDSIAIRLTEHALVEAAAEPVAPPKKDHARRKP